MNERVGAIRPSQLMYSYGVGAVIDLPNFSVIVGGLDGWDMSATGQTPLVEERLLDAVRFRYPQATQLRPAPWMPPQPGNNALADWARAGVPVYIFPRWLRCTGCNRLAPVDENSFFQFKGDVFRPGGALHAKAVIADGERALVTSANLTGNALELNMELGLLVEGGPVPQRLTAHFSELITRGVLRQAS